jgi:hypothetical protein
MSLKSHNAQDQRPAAPLRILVSPPPVHGGKINHKCTVQFTRHQKSRNDCKNNCPHGYQKAQRVVESLSKILASLKQAKNVSVSKMTPELSVTQWWKTPNLKEDEETRKAVWTTTIA